MAWLDDLDNTTGPGDGSENSTFDFNKWINKTKTFEGWKKEKYNDSKKILTVGYGFNLEDPATLKILKSKGFDTEGLSKGTVHMTRAQADPLVADIYKQSYNIAAKRFPNFNTFPDEIKHTVTDMIYNMGEPRFSKFKKMQHALLNNDYNEAAKEIKNSLYATQVGDREIGRAHV